MRNIKLSLAIALILGLFSLLLIVRTHGFKELKFQFDKRYSEISLYLEDNFGIINTNKDIVSSKELINENRISLGIYNPANNPKTFSSFVYFEELIDRKLSYQLLFKTWGDENELKFPKDHVNGWKKLNLIPIITWEPWKRDLKDSTRGNIQPKFSLKSIANGKHDEYITSWAKDAKNVEVPIILRFAHEQSTPIGKTFAYPWQGNPEDFKSAFKHVVGIFRQVGADNVEFMWSPLAYWSDSVSFYYPGDTYVDYIGLSILNHGIGVGEPSNRWKSCNELFIDQYNLIEKYKKKVFVVEFGSSEKGGNKQEWLTDCVRLIQSKEDVHALVLLEVKSDTHYPGVNWGVDTTLKSLETFKYEISVGNFK